MDWNEVHTEVHIVDWNEVHTEVHIVDWNEVEKKKIIIITCVNEVHTTILWANCISLMLHKGQRSFTSFVPQA